MMKKIRVDALLLLGLVMKGTNVRILKKFLAFSYTVQFSHKNAIISSGGRMWFPPLNVSCYAIAMRVLMLCYTALKSMLS